MHSRSTTTRFRSVLVLCATLLFATSGPVAKQAHGSAGGDVLVVALGGYNSCGSSGNPYGIGMYTQVRSLLDKLATQFEADRVKYLIGCLRTDRPPSGEGRFVTSDAPQTLRYGNADVLQSEIERLVGSEETYVHIIGHSYGGWLSMYLADAIGRKHRLAGLYTIDPISPKTCGPVEVLIGAAGCHQAPRDLDSAFIRSVSDSWLNFYQTADSWLTSSSIPEAENFHITYEPDSHTNIDADERVWSRIGAKVVRIARGQIEGR